MAKAGTVKATVKVGVRPSIGPSTIAGGTVTLTAYALAIVGFIQGARDEQTISALIVGTVSLVTVLGGRYAQAIAVLLKRSSWGAEKPAASLTPTVHFGSGTQTSMSTFTTPAAVAADEGPGDELHDAFEDETPADPSAIPKDRGESPAPVATAASAVSHLTASQRARAREMVMQAAYLALKHAPAIHYTQGARRWDGIAKHLRAWRGEYPAYADCSAFATWCLWQGLGHFHVGDVVNGENWLAGWTGTQLVHGKLVVHEAHIKQADLAIYEGHVAVCVGRRADGVQMVISHGSEGGPYLLPLHYRSDLVAVRRYI